MHLLKKWQVELAQGSCEQNKFSQQFEISNQFEFIEPLM